MARIKLDELDGVDALFHELGDIPFETTAATIDAMAEVAEKKVRDSGLRLGVRDPESSVHILDKITHTKPKKTASGGYTDVTFSGSRKRGRTTTRNAEIAFVNEYGREDQAPRPFIRLGVEEGAAEISAAGEVELGSWFERRFEG